MINGFTFGRLILPGILFVFAERYGERHQLKSGVKRVMIGKKYNGIGEEISIIKFPDKFTSVFHTACSPCGINQLPFAFNKNRIPRMTFFNESVVFLYITGNNEARNSTEITQLLE